MGILLLDEKYSLLEIGVILGIENLREIEFEVNQGNLNNEGQGSTAPKIRITGRSLADYVSSKGSIIRRNSAKKVPLSGIDTEIQEYWGNQKARRGNRLNLPHLIIPEKMLSAEEKNGYLSLKDLATKYARERGVSRYRAERVLADLEDMVYTSRNEEEAISVYIDGNGKKAFIMYKISDVERIIEKDGRFADLRQKVPEEQGGTNGQGKYVSLSTIQKLLKERYGVIYKHDTIKRGCNRAVQENILGFKVKPHNGRGYLYLMTPETLELVYDAIKKMRKLSKHPLRRQMYNSIIRYKSVKKYL